MYGSESVSIYYQSNDNKWYGKNGCGIDVNIYDITLTFVVSLHCVNMERHQRKAFYIIK